MAVLLPPTLVIITYFILGNMYFSSLTTFGSASAVAFLILFGIWILQGRLGWKMLQIYPSHRDTMKRVLLFSTLNLLIVILSVTLICWVFDLLSILDYRFTVKTWLRGLMAGAICTIVNQAVYETEASYRRIKISQLEAEQLKKEQLQTQFDSLKEQVNPHFLFNSLNSLSSLIATNPDKAEAFVEEMSQVYRYLLRSNEEQLTTLQKEIDFIESYNMLLQTRFGSGFQPVLQIEEKMKEWLLPPMTLQLLIENAVKHNIVDPDTPLVVQLYTQGEKLVVSNNLQKKNKSVVSNKVGLSNIISKYKLLNYPEVEIKETATEFIVVLPLIKNT
ncbi:MAG: histidine kinase [Chitinophagaceae bacterium]|nr:histidine kinase [Chitinophagaceae bacterium]MCW5926040.1 histidine kinase [Chitinophagaceae bacterium]